MIRMYNYTNGQNNYTIFQSSKLCNTRQTFRNAVDAKDKQALRVNNSTDMTSGIHTVYLQTCPCHRQEQQQSVH